MADSTPKRKPLVLIIASVVVLGLGAGGGFFVTGRLRPTAAHGPGQQADKPGIAHAAPPAAVYPLGELVVNLADTASLRYVKLSVAVGMREPIPEEKVKFIEPVMRDAVIGVVSSRHFTDLHRPGGVERLKQDLQKTIGARLPEGHVAAIYLESFAMQ